MDQDTKTQRESKHSSVDTAINQLHRVFERIEELIDKVNGNPAQVAPPGPVSTDTTLVGLLESGSPRIRERIDQYIDSVNRLDSLLF